MGSIKKVISNNKNYGRNLLIADDDKMICELVEIIFENHFNNIIEVKNGKELVLEARRKKPDLIITDIMMPILSGYRAIAKLQKQDIFHNTAVIFTSSAIRDRDIYEMYRPTKMVSEFINKPFAKKDIVSLAGKLLKEAKNQ